MRNPFDKILNWYFSKNSLPYWSIFCIDCAIVTASGLFSYWLFHDAQTLFENTLPVLCSSLSFALMSVVGFRLFHTYSGFMRYASFIDLMRVTYSNCVNLGLALVAKYTIELPNLAGEEMFARFSSTSILVVFIVSTLLMWVLRVFVKSLYDVAFSNTRAKRVLIYGAMSGGVGLAKNINSLRPKRYVVKGFITHLKKTKHQQIMGEKVYSVNEDIATIIQ